MTAEIAPVTIKGRKGDTVVDTDEHPRATGLETLSKLRPAFSKTGSVTAGNSSGINDAAAALVVTLESTADLKGLSKLGEFVALAWAGLSLMSTELERHPTVWVLTCPAAVTARALSSGVVESTKDGSASDAEAASSVALIGSAP